MALLNKAKLEAKLFKEFIMAKKETPATTQAEYDKAFEEVKSGKQPVPSFDDMGPLPHRIGGLEFVDPKDNERVRKSQEAARVKMLDTIKKSMSGPTVRDAQGNIEYKKKGGAIKAKKMASGGMVKSSASKRADGIAVKGKTRGKIC
jgi:hypothetical protein